MKEPKKPSTPLEIMKPRKFIEVENKIKFAWDQELTLKQLLKLIPKNIKKNNIKFKTFMVEKDTDTAFFYLEVYFFERQINVHYNKQLLQYKQFFKEYKKDLAKYNLLMKKYECDIIKYNIFVHKQELKELENKLLHKK